MAASGPGLAPIRIEYPRGTYGRDDLTAGGDRQHTFNAASQGILTASITGPLPLNPQLNPIQLPNNNREDCYRNATLSVLLQVRPFLNWLRNLNNPDQTLSMLQQIADAYWNPGRSDDQRKSDATNHINPWFALLRHYNGGFQSWDSFMSQTAGQADALEFCTYVLNLAEHALTANISWNHRDALYQLFRIQIVERRAYECGCVRKERQPFGSGSTNMWELSINADASHTPLADLISNYLYDNNTHYIANCPSCGALNVRYHKYGKFRFLPEVFLLGVTHVSTNTGGPIRDDVNARTDTPDVLDFAAVQDYPSVGQDGQNTSETKYQLQSVIAYSGVRGGAQGHYRTYIRRHDGTWSEVDDNRPTRHGYTSLPLQGSFRSRVLVYVKMRGTSSNPTNAVAIQATTHVAPTPATATNQIANQAQAQATNQGDGQASNDDALPPDVLTRDAASTLRELQSRGFMLRSTKALDKLRTIATNYNNAPDLPTRLDFFTKETLLHRLRSTDPLDSRLSKPALIAKLVNQISAQAATDTSTTNAAADTSTINAGAGATAPAAGADGAALPATSQPTVPPPASIDVAAQLRDANTQLQTYVAQLTQQLRQANQDNQRLQATIQTLQPSVGGDTAQNGPNNPASGQPITNQGNAQQTGSITAPQNTIVTAQPSTAIVGQNQTTTTRRILKVTSVDIYEDMNGVRSSHDALILLPGYLANRQLTTKHWCTLESYLPAGGVADTDMQQRYRVFVSVGSQNTADTTLYGYKIEMSIYKSDRQLPHRTDIELLSVQSSQNITDQQLENVRIIRQPANTQTLQQSTPARQSAPGAGSSATAAAAPGTAATSSGAGAAPAVGAAPAAIAGQKRPASHDADERDDIKRMRIDGPDRQLDRFQGVGRTSFVPDNSSFTPGFSTPQPQRQQQQQALASNLLPSTSAPQSQPLLPFPNPFSNAPFFPPPLANPIQNSRGSPSSSSPPLPTSPKFSPPRSSQDEFRFPRSSPLGTPLRGGSSVIGSGSMTGISPANIRASQLLNQSLGSTDSQRARRDARDRRAVDILGSMQTNTSPPRPQSSNQGGLFGNYYQSISDISDLMDTSHSSGGSDRMQRSSSSGGSDRMQDVTHTDTVILQLTSDDATDRPHSNSDTRMIDASPNNGLRQNSSQNTLASSMSIDSTPLAMATNQNQQPANPMPGAATIPSPPSARSGSSSGTEFSDTMPTTPPIATAILNQWPNVPQDLLRAVRDSPLATAGLRAASNTQRSNSATQGINITGQITSQTNINSSINTNIRRVSDNTSLLLTSPSGISNATAAVVRALSQRPLNSRPGANSIGLPTPPSTRRQSDAPDAKRLRR